MLEKFFELNKYKTSVKIEIAAGVTTWLAMVYVIFVSPTMLHAAGMDYNAAFVATCLASASGCFIMGIIANFPVGLAPSMGLSVFFCYTVTGVMGYSWEIALGAVFCSGICFFLISISRLRNKIVNSIPEDLRHGIAAGVGLFLGFIALKNAGIVVYKPNTFVGPGDFTSWPVVMSCLSFAITVALYFRGFKSAVLIGILSIMIINVVLGKTVFNGIVSMPPSISPVFLKLDILGAINIGFVTIVFAFLVVDLFDNTGTLMAINAQGNLEESDASLPRIKKALYCDSLACIVGSLIGTSTIGSYVESCAGISAGGRTGLTSVVIGILFLISLFFMPLAKSVPLYATAPALFFVAVLLGKSFSRINWDDVTSAAPAVITAISMPLTFSISDGIALGIISYVLIKMLSGRFKDISFMMYILMFVFVLKIVLKV